MTNLDIILKSTDITLPTNVHLVKVMVWLVMYGCHVWMWELDYKESWAPKNWCFWIVVFLRVPWTTRRSNQSILKEISPHYLLEGLMLKLKLQYFGYLMWRADPDAGKDWRLEEKGTTEDEMVGWHHWLNGHEFGWTQGVGDGQRGLACWGSWCRKVLDTTEWLNWTDWIHFKF